VVLIAINDLIADGRDVSWLWDVDFEMLAGRVERVVAGGLRAEDLAVRLEYAGIAAGAIEVERSYEAALDRALAHATSGRLFILPTYTAMLAIRAVLERRGVVGRFWE
jgi:lipid II isoglutaminyl synthase (glutamine-hydrolysing)